MKDTEEIRSTTVERGSVDENIADDCCKAETSLGSEDSISDCEPQATAIKGVGAQFTNTDNMERNKAISDKACEHEGNDGKQSL